VGYERVFATISRAAPLGEKVLADGTRLIGHVPHVAPEAWLHIVFPGLGDEEILRVESEIERPLPAAYRTFLRTTNGLGAFSDALAMYGLRQDYRRSGDASYQPFSIVVPNTIERPLGVPDAAVFVGGYGWDGSLLYIEAESGRVYRCDRDSGQPLNEWPGFPEVLDEEILRLAAMHDAAGHLVDPSRPTVPSGDNTRD